MEKEWTEKEVRNFVRETFHFLELLKENPHLLEPTGKHKNLYRGRINRLTFLKKQDFEDIQEYLIEYDWLDQ